MKTISSTILGLLASISIVVGGGPSSVVHLTEVHSVKVEPEKITIVGTGHVELRIMTDREPVNSSAFGQPAQLVRAITAGGTFEIIPYFSDPKIKGVPTGGHDADELKRLSIKWWEQMKGTYASVRVGDSVTIGYQQDLITISEFRIQRIIGAGEVTVHPKSNTAEQEGAGLPATRSESKPERSDKSQPESEGGSR